MGDKVSKLLNIYICLNHGVIKWIHNSIKDVMWLIVKETIDYEQ